MGHGKCNCSETRLRMKTNKTPSSSNTKSDSSKLVSLLALAAGAAAMPQTSNADIIFTDQSVTISWTGITAFLINNLPGDAQLGFAAHASGLLSSARYITGGKRGGGYVQMKLQLVTQPLKWDQIPAGVASLASFASADLSFYVPSSFSDNYLAFQFKDSTQVGSPMRYGWVGLNLQNSNLMGGGDFPKLTVNGWAYDDTGAQIAMGAKAVVPEPSSAALLALGALTLGARGMRAWRRNRTSDTQS